MRPERFTCFCSSCGADFGSISAFDRHRIGTHDYRFDRDHLDGRRCMDPEEMLEVGMHQDGLGRWRRMKGNPHAEGREPQPVLWGAARAA